MQTNRDGGEERRCSTDGGGGGGDGCLQRGYSSLAGDRDGDAWSQTREAQVTVVGQVGEGPMMASTNQSRRKAHDGRYASRLYHM
jgi:hypothetical protein